MTRKLSTRSGLILLSIFLGFAAGSASRAAGSSTASIKGTLTAGTSAGTQSISLTGARITLTNQALVAKPLKAVSDGAGKFAFISLPAGSYMLLAEAANLSSVTKSFRLADGDNLTVDIELTATLSESVTINEEEGLVSAAETTTSNIVRENTLQNVPLRAENYESTLPLTPGVVRDNNNGDHLKGANSGASAYTVNGVDVTDPVTGDLAFDIPIEAAASVEIEENPYSAEFGRLTGGATNLQTKGGGNAFRYSFSRFFPTLRNIVSGPVDSFRPRVTLSGALIKDRIFFLQSFEYHFTRTRVPNLVAPHDDSTFESFSSFSQLDFVLNKRNRIKLVAAIFPEKLRYVGLDTFDPQSTTPNLKEHGFLFSVSEQAIFNDSSFLSSRLSDYRFDVDVFAQGVQPLTLAPDLNSGNFFADTRRRTHRLQWQEVYYASPFNLGGQHSWTIGTEVGNTNISGQFQDDQILIRRSNGTLAQRIGFTGNTTAQVHLNELAAFLQDRWVLSPRFTVDVGLRLDRDGIVRRNNLAPRFAFAFLPVNGARTVIRGGAGVFYNRIPFSAGFFDRTVAGMIGIPERIVTRFAADGISIADGPRLFTNEVAPDLRDPRSIRFSLQVDQGITQNLTLRFGYLQRHTVGDATIDPVNVGSSSALLLSTEGRSNYREFQALALYNSKRWGRWNASYVFSKADGDLNTVNNYLGNIPAFVIRGDEYGPLPFDVRHRALVYGEMQLPLDIIFSPAVEIHSGFPYSVVNDQLDFVGSRDRGGHFPTYMSVDAQVTKGFRIPGFEKHKARVGIAVFNILDRFNPRDIQNNLNSANFGQFYNGLGTSIRGKFAIDF